MPLPPLETSYDFVAGRCGGFDGETTCGRPRDHDGPCRLYDPAGSGRWRDVDDTGRECRRGLSWLGPGDPAAAPKPCTCGPRAPGPDGVAAGRAGERCSACAGVTTAIDWPGLVEWAGPYLAPAPGSDDELMARNYARIKLPRSFVDMPLEAVIDEAVPPGEVHLRDDSGAVLHRIVLPSSFTDLAPSETVGGRGPAPDHVVLDEAAAGFAGTGARPLWDARILPHHRDNCPPCRSFDAHLRPEERLADPDPAWEVPMATVAVPHRAPSSGDYGDHACEPCRAFDDHRTGMAQFHGRPAPEGSAVEGCPFDVPHGRHAWRPPLTVGLTQCPGLGPPALAEYRENLFAKAGVERPESLRASTSSRRAMTWASSWAPMSFETGRDGAPMTGTHPHNVAELWPDLPAEARCQAAIPHDEHHFQSFCSLEAGHDGWHRASVADRELTWQSGLAAHEFRDNRAGESDQAVPGGAEPRPEFRISASRAMIKRCPFVDELDEGRIELTWAGKAPDLHDVARAIDAYAGRPCSHEVATSELAARFGAHVVTTWVTAGLEVRCEAWISDDVGLESSTKGASDGSQ